MGAFSGDIPIVSVDKRSGAFVDASGTRYFEVASDVFAAEGGFFEGAVGYHGSGSHGGHVVLKPFYRYERGKWIMPRKTRS